MPKAIALTAYGMMCWGYRVSGSILRRLRKLHTIQAKSAVSVQVSITRHISCLWFEVDAFDAAMAGAAALAVEAVLPRHHNPPSGEGGPSHWECWLRDPDGYTVVIASPDGTKG